LQAALTKFRADVTSPLRLARYLGAFRSEVVSDVPANDLFSLAIIAERIDAHKVRNVVLPGNAQMIGAASVVVLAPEAQAVFRGIRDDAVL
jgi:hypothetical protein